jgi:hypothetical protein
VSRPYLQRFGQLLQAKGAADPFSTACYIATGGNAATSACATAMCAGPAPLSHACKLQGLVDSVALYVGSMTGGLPKISTVYPSYCI